MSVDQQKVRREGMRWNILNILDKARPYTTNEVFLGDVLRAIYPDVSPDEVRKQLDYLEDRKLVDIKREPSGIWFANLIRYGVDIVEFTVDCEPGIARPVKYWNG